MVESLLESVLDATRERVPPPSMLEVLVRERSDARALALWVLAARGGEVPARDELAGDLVRAIAALDRALSAQLDAILHHAQFQALEASWRGLALLVSSSDGVESVKVRVLSVTWRELARDLERAIEFDQSQLFRKVYSDEFGTPGGEPFALLLGDYFVSHRPRPDHPLDDVSVLRGIAHVAAASFAPFVASVHPSLFGLDSFVDLERPFDLARTFQAPEYSRWNAMREMEEARFVALTLPRVAVRGAWGDDGERADGFCYEEATSAPDLRERLWANACYAFGTVAIRAFAQSGWPASIRGVERGVEGGGLVSVLPAQYSACDPDGLVPLPPTDVVIPDTLEKALSDAGLMALSWCTGTPWAAFYSTPSVQRPRAYAGEQANANSKLSALLSYILCTSRFAHHVKMIGRDRQGTFVDARELERFLSEWLQRYIVTDDDATAEMQARAPLREAAVSVREIPGKPGSFFSVIQLRPHFQLDELTTALKLVTEISAGR